MAYLGNKPVNNFVSFAKQDITGNGGTSYSLDYPVTSANDIELFINNVRQEPTEAYSCSGSTLTLTEAVTSTDDVYVIFRGRALQPQMQVAQRGTSATGVTSSGYHTVDRWAYYHGGTLGSLAWTQTQSTDAPPGYANSLKLECTTAASFGSSHNAYIRQFFEGQDLQGLAFGTSSAKKISVSFWVKSNVVGDYTLSLYQQDNARTTGKTYTVNASGTWEFKTLTFDGDTVGGFDNDNNTSMQMAFFLTAGSSQTAGPFANGTWSSYTPAIYATQNQVNVGTNVGDYWQVTGVQLEVGSTPTPFEHRSYGEELATCLRYFYRTQGATNTIGTGTAYNGSDLYVPFRFPVEMRATPTASYSDDDTDVRIYGDGTSQFKSALSFDRETKQSIRFQVFSLSLTTGRSYWLEIANADAYIDLDAEL